jgi:beta-xylosidase
VSVERIGRHKLVPLFDLPMADVSVCRGGDEAWYLTGTVAGKSQESGVRGQEPGHPTLDTRHSPPDFENNDGIYLWRSTDLDTWTPLGKVWDIEKEGSAWAKQYRIPGDNPVRTDFCRGVTAPEIHFINGAYYLAYSMNGRGTGLLKSKTGKAEGPYEDVGRITAMGESPSLYADAAAGTKYWLWGKGLQIAALTADGTSVEPGHARDLFPDIFLPKGSTAAHNSLGMRDVTGPFLFDYFDAEVKRVRRALAFSAVTHTWQRANRDAVVAVADQLDGIWKGGASRLIPHGGQTTVFPGPGGEMFATFWGADPSAVWRDRPGIVPMELWRPGPYHDMAADPMRYPRMVHGDYFTRRGDWATMMPPKGLEYIQQRDPEIFAAPDGWLYFSASPSQFVNQPDFKWEGLPYWRSKELAGPWEFVGYLYTMEQMCDDPDWPAIGENYKHWNNNKGAWEPSMCYANGTYWITIWFGGTGWGKDVCWKEHRGALLRSTSGKAEGPYEMHTIDLHINLQALLFDDDGSVYGMADGPVWRMTGDLKALDGTWTERDGVTPIQLAHWDKTRMKSPRSVSGENLTGDCNLMFKKVDGRYIAQGLGGMNSYDGLFWFADDIRGPYHRMGVLPFLGNAPLFQTPDGRWFTMTQLADHGYFLASPYRKTDKFDTNLVVYEVAVDAKSEKPSIWPKHDLGHLAESVYQEGCR